MSVGNDSACLGLHVTVYMLQFEGEIMPTRGIILVGKTKRTETNYTETITRILNRTPK